MRRKKLKASKRIVRYFKMHFGFREPFKVLMDGNFLHSMAQMKYDNLEDMISTLLGGKVRLFVPSCAMRELRDLAKQDKAYSAAVALARKFLRHKDACAPTQSTNDILLKQVENGNDQHWWLATQDKSLWTTLREDPSRAVPILYASATGLHLLPPSDCLKEQVSNTLMVHDNHGVCGNSGRPRHLKAQCYQAQMNGRLHEHAAVGEAGAVAPKAKLTKGRRKHAAAPNPLSVKKSSRVQKDVTGDGQSKKRIRRKRQNDGEEIR